MNSSPIEIPAERIEGMILLPDFMFELTAEEADSLRSPIATLNRGRGKHRKYLPHAFTEHGAVMLATILNSAKTGARHASNPTKNNLKSAKNPSRPKIKPHRPVF